MSARDDILARVRDALGSDRVTIPPPPAGSAANGHSSPTAGPPARGSAPSEEVVALFAERVADYKATVLRCPSSEAASTVAAALQDVTSVVVPQGFPEVLVDEAKWPVSCRRVADEGLTSRDLDGVDAVVSLVAVGIAVTGTFVLDHGPGQGRRALSLVPDLLVAVIREDQVVEDVGSAVAQLDPGRPQTWISGPSATSDIELSRVEGVHGPRTLMVVLVSGDL